MQPFQGILFPEHIHPLLQELVDGAKALGPCDVYPLPRMFRGRGEIRIAHVGPVGQKKKARGVFARLRPTQGGATFIYSKKLSHGPVRTPISKRSLPEIMSKIERWRSAKLPPIRTNQKVEPNKPGTVQGGQFESNRRKH
jgi:hypothetical protein